MNDERTLKDIATAVTSGTLERRDDDVLIKNYPLLIPGREVIYRDVYMPRKLMESLAKGPSLTEIITANSVKNLEPLTDDRSDWQCVDR